MRKKNTAKSVRISKKRVFVKKLVSTFIVCALFTAAITAGVVTYIRGECISVSGQASRSIRLGYDKGLGETFIRMVITDLSGHNDITDTFVAVYDENGHRYFLDSFGTMSAQDTLTPGRTTLTAQELTQLTARIAQTDPVLSNAVVQANQNQKAVIYRQSDLEELFKSLS